MFGVPRYIWLLMILFAILFLLFPQIDLATASFFYDGNFYLKEHPAIVFLYRYSPYLALAVGLFSLIALVSGAITKREILGVRKKVWAYLLLALLLGPGLIVNLVFKEHWGRARPVQITQFGGQKQFTPAFVPTDQCRHNCSFSCGHASSGFYFIAPALLVRNRKKRYLLLGAATAFGFLIGLGRMAQGGHFLSDVIFSFFFVLISTLILYRWFFEREPDA